MKALFLIAAAVLSFSKMSIAAPKSDVVILDVRTDEEFAENHLKGARQINFNAADFKDQIAKLDRTKTYKIYCRSGNRSGKAIAQMKEMGFKDLENLGSVKDASKRLDVPLEGKAP